MSRAREVRMSPPRERRRLESHHRARVALREADNYGPTEAILVRGGKRAYLWFGFRDRACIGTLSGPATLRKLAKAILAEVGDE